MASDVPSKIIFDRPISNIARGNIRLRRGHFRSADCVYKIKHSSCSANTFVCSSRIGAAALSPDNNAGELRNEI